MGLPDLISLSNEAKTLNFVIVIIVLSHVTHYLLIMALWVVSGLLLLKMTPLWNLPSVTWHTYRFSLGNVPRSGLQGQTVQVYSALLVKGLAVQSTLALAMCKSCCFQWSCMDVRVEPYRRLSTEESMLSNCGAGEDFESPLNCREILPANPKGNQPWILIRRTDAEVEAPILWPPDVKSLLTGKDPDAGKDWGWEEKGATEDEMVRWHRRLNGHEFEQAPGDGEGQGSLACYSPWGCKESNII